MILNVNIGRRRKNKQLREEWGLAEGFGGEAVNVDDLAPLTEGVEEAHENFNKFLGYQRQLDKGGSTVEMKSAAHSFPSSADVCLHHHERIRGWVKLFLEEIFIRKTGDFQEKIPDKWADFMTQLFKKLKSVAIFNDSVKNTYVFNPDFLPKDLWGTVLNSPGVCEFPTKKSKTRFFNAALLAFNQFILITGCQDFPKVDRSMVYMIDPVTRQKVRKDNRAKAVGHPLLSTVFTKDRTPLMFINSILADQSLFADIPLEIMKKDTPYSSVVQVINTILSLGLLDAFSCDFLLASLDCFASSLQLRFKMGFKNPKEK